MDRLTGRWLRFFAAMAGRVRNGVMGIELSEFGDIGERASFDFRAAASKLRRR
jgi:hypothetical protein